MLLLVTIALVLVAAVTLLIGIFTDNLPLIFLSIGASAAAAIVLAVLSQVNRRRDRGGPPALGRPPLPRAEPAVREPTVATAVEEAPAPVQAEPTTVLPVAEPAARAEPARAPASTTRLPIANYDSLRVSQIVAQLENLDLDQLEEVAQHEEANKNRNTILTKIDDLMDRLEAAQAETPATTPAAEEEPVAVAAGAGESDGLAARTGFPIPDYDTLSEDEIIAMLEDLDADELEAVADREEVGQNRDRVLDAIDDRLDVLEGVAPAPAATATKAPAKRGPAKKAAAPARKAASTPSKRASKAASSATTAPAKKAPTKRAAAPAKSAAASPKRASAKKAGDAAAPPPAKRAAKATTTTKKASTTAKKAAPVKKAGVAKKTNKQA